MGLRFYRRLGVLPGVRLNLSRSGPSVSVGTSGAWYTMGPRGTRTTVGISGSGISYTSYGSGSAVWLIAAVLVGLALISAL